MSAMPPAARAVFKDVQRQYSATYEEIIGDRRHHHLVHARSAIANRLRKERGYSLMKIALLLHCHHTTVMAYLRGGRADAKQAAE